MKKLFTFLLVVTTLSVFTASAISAQSGNEIGKIFTKSEAEQLFGPVTSSAQINYGDLLKALLGSGNVLQFGIKGSSAVITNDKRELLTGLKAAVGTNEKLAVFSKNMLRQFLSASRWMGKGTNLSKYDTVNGDLEVVLEIRASGVTTITAGEATLEFATQCPPFCDWDINP